MSVRKEDLYRLIDRLNDEDQEVVHTLLQRLTNDEDQKILEADNSPLTQEEINDIEQARKEVARGETVDLEEVKRELNL